MNKKKKFLQSNLDEALHQFYAGEKPEKNFAGSLDEQLRQHHEELISKDRKSHSQSKIKRRSIMNKLRTQPIFALLLTIFAFLALTGIVYAVGRLTGFIQGFGFTTEGENVFVLAEPAESKSGETTLQINKVVSGDNHLWMELTIKGETWSEWENFSDAFIIQPEEDPIRCNSTSSSGISEDEVEVHYECPALADPSKGTTLQVENLYGQDFAIPFKLKPVEADEVVPEPVELQNPLQSESIGGVQLVLDHVAVDSDKTIYQVSLHSDQPHIGTQGSAGYWSVTLSDENGSLYPLTDITPELIAQGIDDTHIYKTIPFMGSEKLTLKLSIFPPSGEVYLTKDFPPINCPTFTFDPGENVEMGQTWKLNQEITAGDFKLKVVSAVLADESLSFEIEHDPSVNSVMFYSSDPLVTDASSTPVQNGNIFATINLSGIPDQIMEIQVVRVYYHVKGDWEIQWQPPAAPEKDSAASSSTPLPTVYPKPTPTAITGNPFLLEIKQLADKFDAPFQEGPTWVHVIKETDTEQVSGLYYPPEYLKNEQWYEIDAEGYITRSVSLDYDKDGHILQQSGTVGDYSVDFTYGFSGFNDGTLSLFSMDTLTQSLDSAAQYGTQVTHEDSTCENGNDCLLVTLLDTFKSPMQKPGEEQAFTGSGEHFWIDKESGQQVKWQSFWVFEDGSESNTSTERTILVEKVNTPPQSILDILSRVIIVL